MNAEKHTELLEEVLIPYLEKSNNTNFQLHQDNAPVHATTLTKKWHIIKNISQMDLPSLFSDPNPVENI